MERKRQRERHREIEVPLRASRDFQTAKSKESDAPAAATMRWAESASDRVRDHAGKALNLTWDEGRGATSPTKNILELLYSCSNIQNADTTAAQWQWLFGRDDDRILGWIFYAAIREIELPLIYIYKAPHLIRETLYRWAGLWLSNLLYARTGAYNFPIRFFSYTIKVCRI